MKKRNKAKPGFNRLPYVIYKKCMTIIHLIHKSFIKIWNSRDIPHCWGIAIMILLGKSDISDLPSEFRPIALGSTCGKIFFTGLFNRLHDYFINNNYIQRNIQQRIHEVGLWLSRSHIQFVGNTYACYPFKQIRFSNRSHGKINRKI